MAIFTTALKSQLKYSFRIPSQLYHKLFGSAFECNICGYLADEFRSDHWLKSTICPACFSYIRHRMLWALLNADHFYNKEKILRDKSIIHFAPEPSLRAQISQLSKEYRTADFFSEGYEYANIDLTLDLTNMNSLGDESVDCLIAFDVLEHIKDDKKALQEIYRVLKKGGVTILTVPQKDMQTITEEDIFLEDPEERARRFGQSDHYRIYGTDFKELLENSGFSVSVFSAKNFSDEEVKRHVLAPPVPSTNPLCTNNQRIYFGRKPE